MIKVEHEEAIKSCSFFDGYDIVIKSIYRNDPFEKCFLIEKGKEKYKARIATKEFPRTVNSERNAIKYLQKNNINWAPKIYFDGRNHGFDIIIYEYFDGVSIDKLNDSISNETIIKLRNQLIDRISELHSIRGHIFGDFIGTEFKTWEEFLSMKFQKHLTKASNINIISKPELHKIERVFKKNKNYYEQVESRLIHFDIKPANIVYEAYSGALHLIDFELCRFGDVNMEFSRIITFSSIEGTTKSPVMREVLKHYLQSGLHNFAQSQAFLMYKLYNLLAYYTTSYLKHNITRSYLIRPIKETIQKLH